MITCLCVSSVGICQFANKLLSFMVLRGHRKIDITTVFS